MPVTYVTCDAPLHGATSASCAYAAARSDWTALRIAGPHDVMIANPGAVIDLLLKVADRESPDPVGAG